VTHVIGELLLLTSRPSTDDSWNVLTRTEVDRSVRYLATA